MEEQGRPRHTDVRYVGARNTESVIDKCGHSKADSTNHKTNLYRAKSDVHVIPEVAVRTLYVRLRGSRGCGRQ